MVSLVAEHSRLTARQKRILARVAHGDTNDQIAACLYVSIDVVKKDLVQLKRKVGARSRQGLARYYFHNVLHDADRAAWARVNNRYLKILKGVNDKELQVLEALIDPDHQDKTYKELAVVLGMGAGTIQDYLGRFCLRLRLRETSNPRVVLVILFELSKLSLLQSAAA